MSVFSESNDHSLKYVNLRFVHLTTITYEQLDGVYNGSDIQGGLVCSKFGAEHFALQCSCYYCGRTKPNVVDLIYGTLYDKDPKEGPKFSTGRAFHDEKVVNQQNM